MSSKTKFFRSFGNQLKNILRLKRNHLAYQAFASEEQFQIACKANDELQFRTQCMVTTALEMRRSRRQGCRAKYRWNQEMVRKVSRRSSEIPSCWDENGEYVFGVHMKTVCRGLSLIDLRQPQDDIIEVTSWTKNHKDTEEGSSSKFPPSPSVSTKRTRSSVSALFSRVVPCVKSSKSVTESSSTVSCQPRDVVAAPAVESPEMMPEPDLPCPEIMSETDIPFTGILSRDISHSELESDSDLQSPEMNSEPDSPYSEMTLKPIVRRAVRTPTQVQLESLIIMSHFLKERPQWRHRKINVDEWTKSYAEKLRQHYNKMF